MKSYISFLVYICVGVVVCFSQNISVESFKLIENDLDARINYPKRDQNGDLCAIIKIVTTETNFEWDSDALGIVSAERKTGEYWLYVPKGARFLTIKHNELGILRMFQYPIPINSASVYEMNLITANIEQIVRKVEKITQWLVVDSDPKGANFFINETLVGTTPYSGKFQEREYKYRIELPKYYTDAGIIKLKDKRETLFFKMRPRFGSLSINSEPEEGITIYLNDENTGKTTPATLSKISSGEHSIKLIDKWYQPQTKKILVNDNLTTNVEFILEPAFSDIIITTNPSASIYIDDIKQGNGSCNIRLLTGVYTIKAEREYYHADQQQLVVEAGKTQTLTLSPKPRTGNIDITSTPYDASIKLNGKDYGTTPITIRDLLIGTYTLTLEKEGYSSKSQSISIKEGETTDVNEILTSGIEVTISSKPSGATLLIDNVSIGSTPFTGTLNPGVHIIKLIIGNKELESKIELRQGFITDWEFYLNENKTKFNNIKETKNNHKEHRKSYDIFIPKEIISEGLICFGLTFGKPGDNYLSTGGDFGIWGKRTGITSSFLFKSENYDYGRISVATGYRIHSPLHMVLHGGIGFSGNNRTSFVVGATLLDSKEGLLYLKCDYWMPRYDRGALLLTLGIGFRAD